MKLWHKLVIALVIILLIVGGILWCIPFHQFSKGQLVAIGYSRSNPSIPGIYLFNPWFRSWHRLPTDNLYPWRIAWSPNGKKIAFTYSTSSADDAAITGIAILNLENMQTQQVYISPSNESLNVVTWSPDGQRLIFDVYRNNDLIALQLINLQTGKLQTIPFLKAVQPKYFDIDHIEVAQNTDFVLGGSQGIFIAPPDLESLRQITPYMAGFFLTPDRKEITTPCAQSALCIYSIDTNEFTKTYPNLLPPYGNFHSGNWSYDEKDVVYLSQGGGEEDPQYIMLVDIPNKQIYIIYDFRSFASRFGPYVWQLAWYSAK